MTVFGDRVLKEEVKSVLIQYGVFRSTEIWTQRDLRSAHAWKKNHVMTQ